MLHCPRTSEVERQCNTGTRLRAPAFPRVRAGSLLSAIDRHPARLEQDLDAARGRLGFIPLGRRHGQRIDDEDDDALGAVELRRHPGLLHRLQHLQRIEHAAHVHVVRDAVVHQVQIGPLGAVAELSQRPERSDRARGRARRIVGVREVLHPGRRDPVAGTAVVVQRDRRKNHRHRRRGGRRPRQRDSVQVRAQDIEHALLEDQTRPARNVGGRREDQGSLAAVEVTEGGIVEQDFVVQLRSQFGATPPLG